MDLSYTITVSSAPRAMSFDHRIAGSWCSSAGGGAASTATVALAPRTLLGGGGAPLSVHGRLGGGTAAVAIARPPTQKQRPGPQIPCRLEGRVRYCTAELLAVLPQTACCRLYHHRSQSREPQKAPRPTG